MTAADLLKSSRDNSTKCELLDGTLSLRPLDGYHHGVICAQIGGIIAGPVVAQNLGHVVAAGTGFLLRRNPDHVRAPDCAFVAAGRLASGSDPIGYAELAPDFVVEVISPGDTAAEVQERVDDWLRTGTAVVWAAYSSLKEVVVWRGVGVAERKSGDEELDAEPAIPGFRCKVSDLFGD